MEVLSGVCKGGPKNGQSLATMHGRKVSHPDDLSGDYYHRPAQGTTPSQWIWVKNKDEKK